MAIYLITGGAGFIGSSIAEALLAKGETVRVLDDFSSGRRENLASLPGAVELFEGSIVDPATVARAVRGVDVIFHEAAIPSVIRSVENPQASMLAGVQGTTVVLDAARSHSVRRVIFAASSSAYGDTPTLPKVETMPAHPLSPYAASKLTGEHLMRIFAELYGIETVSLRYFNVFGPRQDPKSEYAAVIPKFITAALRRQRPIVYGDGEQTRDFCHIDNAVSANLLAAGTQRKLAGEIVNIACGKRTSLNELIAALGELSGAPLEPDYRPGRAGDIRDSLADVEAAGRLLGYSPVVDWRTGLRRTYAAFAKAGGPLA
jgi:UDP-N-acetylglucosamine/UDP-N-acetyl-alpha-D-glucosaminouronate 4-epimerase